MAEEQEQGYDSAYFSEYNTKIRDTEEKQRLLKERVLLIGQNLIETKERLEKNLTELKIGVDKIKEEMEKMKAMILRHSEDLSKKAKISDVEILARQMKMFQPLEFIKSKSAKKR